MKEEKKIEFTQKWIGDAVKKLLQKEDIYESCWLGCKAENNYFPQDLVLVIGAKIPDFISFLEENLTGKEDFKQAIDFIL